MNFANIVKEFTGQSGNGGQNIRSKIPGGLVGGAAAGGVIAMLMGSKSMRKTATKAAKYGGVAMLGGLAYKAYRDWQHKEPATDQIAAGQSSNMATNMSVAQNSAPEAINSAASSDSFQIALIKAMIASARADGKIDPQEQSKISDAVDSMNLDNESKGQLLELFIKPISVEDIVGDLATMEQKAEVYLASCLVIDLDHEGEYAHLSNLSQALQLPPGLEHQLRAQASEAQSHVA